MLTNREQRFILTTALEKAYAMIDWLAENCVYMASMAFPFSKETEVEMKQTVLEEAEQAAREGRKWGEIPKSTAVQDADRE